MARDIVVVTDRIVYKVEASIIIAESVQRTEFAINRLYLSILEILDI